MLAYFDLYSGASGDMILGSLLDAGLDLSALEEGLAGLELQGYAISAAPVMKGAIGATALRVETRSGQPERHLRDILELIARSGLPERARERARRVFTLLGEAEARVHRIALDEVHFHEVGAVDSIVDVVGACLGLELLGADEIYASPFPLALGTHHVDHGWLPMPGPATLEIMATASAPTVPPPTDVRAELVTPTGAALICALARFERPPMILHRIGYGAGRADLPHPNILRVWLGERAPAPAGSLAQLGEESAVGETPRDVVLLETNIDDMNPQIYGYLFDLLLDIGALDVYCTPVGMKKNRQGTMLSVLCRTEHANRFQALLLRETTTMGVRVQPVHRVVAERTECLVETPLGPVRAKMKVLDDRVVAATPEYDDCLKLARRHEQPLIEVLALARRCAEDMVQRQRADGKGETE